MNAIRPNALATACWQKKSEDALHMSKFVLDDGTCSKPKRLQTRGNVRMRPQHSFELRNHQTLPKNEVPCYTCKEFRALTANVYFRVAYSLNIEQGTSFSGRVW